MPEEMFYTYCDFEWSIPDYPYTVRCILLENHPIQQLEHISKEGELHALNEPKVEMARLALIRAERRKK